MCQLSFKRKEQVKIAVLNNIAWYILYLNDLFNNLFLFRIHLKHNNRYILAYSFVLKLNLYKSTNVSEPFAEWFLSHHIKLELNLWKYLISLMYDNLKYQHKKKLINSSIKSSGFISELFEKFIMGIFTSRGKIFQPIQRSTCV